MKYVIGSLLLILLVSCEGDETTVVSSDEDNQKDLFSLWESTEGNIIDLQDGDFFQPNDMDYFIETNDSSGECDCEISVIGTQTSGIYAINNCVYVEGSSSTDPGCHSLPGTGVYSKTTNNILFLQPDGFPVFLIFE